jgi:hypothetical protein
MDIVMKKKFQNKIKIIIDTNNNIDDVSNLIIKESIFKKITIAVGLITFGLIYFINSSSILTQNSNSSSFLTEYQNQNSQLTKYQSVSSIFQKVLNLYPNHYNINLINYDEIIYNFNKNTLNLLNENMNDYEFSFFSHIILNSENYYTIIQDF